MDHDEAAPLLGAYATYALEAEEFREVGAHLATCARCRTEAHRYERILSLLTRPV